MYCIWVWGLVTMQLENVLFVLRSRDGPDGPPGSDFPMSLAVCLYRTVPYHTIPYRTLSPSPSLSSFSPLSSSLCVFSSLLLLAALLKPQLCPLSVLVLSSILSILHHGQHCRTGTFPLPTPRVFGYPLTNPGSLSPAKYARLSRFLPARTDRQAAIAWGAGEPLSVEDVEVAPPKAHEVRIQINHTGVCHTGQ